MIMSKRILAMLLAVVMVASLAPMTVMQAAAENITEAISDLGDALAVNSEEPAAADLADDGETVPPAEAAEEPVEEPAETPAEEPEKTAAPETEQEQTEAPASEPAANEAELAVMPADETTTEAVTKAARSAPLQSGPEIDIGLNSFNETTGRFEFTNNEFRILQLTDVQTDEGNKNGDNVVIDNGINRIAVNAIYNSIKLYKPDLIVMTGDQVGGGSMSRANFQAVANHYRDIVCAADPNVKFAIVFGNHDPQLSIDGVSGESSTQIQYDCFKTAFGANFVDYDVANLGGAGNGKVDIYADGAVAAQAFMFDSQQSCIGASSGETSGSANQAIVNWYNSNATKPNVVFEHIILNEIALYGSNGDYITAGQSNGLVTGVSSGGIGSISGQTASVVLANGATGELNEVPCPYGTGAGKLATKKHFIGMADHQCLGAFFGHDHMNTFGGPVTVYGKTVYFYATPGMTCEEYYGGKVPGVRTITLTKSGSSVSMSTEVLGMDELEVQSAETRVQQNEIGAINGGVPAVGTLAVPSVLYKGAAANNSDPVNNQSFGGILQKYVYNYKTMHIDAANTTVRFVLPAAATAVSILAKVSTSTTTTVNMSGTSITMPTPTSVTLSGGDKLYTCKLPEGANLGVNAQDVVYTVTYTQGGETKTIYAASCVEDIKIPAGYAVWKCSSGDTSDSAKTVNADYLFALSGDNVYSTAVSTNTAYFDTQFMGFSNGWLKLFSYAVGNFNTSSGNYDTSYGQYQSGGSDARYALAYNGSNYGIDGSSTTQNFSGNTTNIYSMGLRPYVSGHDFKPPKADIYVDTGATTTASNGQASYGATLSFINSHVASDVSTSKNIRDYATYVAGIGFRSRGSDGASVDYTDLISGSDPSALYVGYWRSHSVFSSALVSALEAEEAADNRAANTQVANVYASNQSLSNVTTTHQNGNLTDANEIPNGGLLSYELTSTGSMVANGAKLSMIVGGRTAQRSYSTNYIIHTLQTIDLNFYTYDKTTLRTLVKNEMRQARNGSDTEHIEWQQALVNAQAVLADARTDQTTIDSVAANLAAKRNAVLDSEFGAHVGEPTVPTDPGQLISAFTVPPILYTKEANSSNQAVIIASDGGDGLEINGDSEPYNTAVSVTAASGVTNINLYIVDENDENADLILHSDGNTLSDDFPGGQSTTLDTSTHDGVVYYRLDYDYNGKTYTAYAASYVRERPITVGRWHFDVYNGCENDQNGLIHGFRYTDTYNVSSVLARAGAGAIVSAWSGEDSGNSFDQYSSASQGFGRDAATNEWSASIPPVTGNSVTNRGKINVDGVSQYDSASPRRGIEYINWNNTTDANDWDFRNNYSHGGLVQMVNCSAWWDDTESKRTNRQDRTGLRAPNNNSEDVADFLCINFFYDEQFAANADNAALLTGTQTLKQYSGSHLFSTHGKKTNYNMQNISECSYAGVQYVATNSKSTAQGVRYKWGFNSGTGHSEVSNDNNNIISSYSVGSTSYQLLEREKGLFAKTGNGDYEPSPVSFTAKSLPDEAYSLWYHRRGYDDTGYYGWHEAKPDITSSYGVLFAFVKSDRSNAHSIIDDSIVVPLSKDDYYSSWWEDYRDTVWQACENAGNIYTGEDSASDDLLEDIMEDRAECTLADFKPLWDALNEVCFKSDGSSWNFSSASPCLGRDGSVAQTFDSDVYYKTVAANDPVSDSQYYTFGNFKPDTIQPLIDLLKLRNSSLFNGASEADAATYANPLATLTSEYNPVITAYANRIKQAARALKLKTLSDYTGSLTINDSTQSGYTNIEAFIDNDNNFSWVNDTVVVYTINSDGTLNTTNTEYVYTQAARTAVAIARSAVQAFDADDILTDNYAAYTAALSSLETTCTTHYNQTGSLVTTYTTGWDGIFNHLTTNARTVGTENSGTARTSSFSVSASNLPEYLSNLYGSGVVDTTVGHPDTNPSISTILSDASSNSPATKTALSNQSTFNTYVEQLYNELNAITVSSSSKMDAAATAANTERDKSTAKYHPSATSPQTGTLYQYTTASRGALDSAVSTITTAAGGVSAWNATPEYFGWHASSGSPAAFDGIYAAKIRKAAGLTTDTSATQSNQLVLESLYTAALNEAITYAQGVLYKPGTTDVKTFDVLTNPATGAVDTRSLYTRDDPDNNVDGSVEDLIDETTGALTLALAKQGNVPTPTAANWLTQQAAIDELVMNLYDETDINNTINIVNSSSNTRVGTINSAGGNNGLVIVDADYTYLTNQRSTPMYSSSMDYTVDPQVYTLPGDINATVRSSLWSGGPLLDGTVYVAERYYTAVSWGQYITAYNNAGSVTQNLKADSQGDINTLTQTLYNKRIALDFQALNTSSSFAAAGTAITNATGRMNEHFYLEKYVNDYDLFASRLVVSGATLTKTYSTGESSTSSDLSTVADRLRYVYSDADRGTIARDIDALQTYYNNNGNDKTMVDEQAMIAATARLNNRFNSESNLKLTPQRANALITDQNDPNYGKKLFGAGAYDLFEDFIAGTFDETNNTFTSDKLPDSIAYQILPYLVNINTILCGNSLVNATYPVNGEDVPMYEALNYYTKALYDYCTGTRAQNATFAMDLKNTMYAYFDTEIAVDPNGELASVGLLGGTPAAIKMLNQTEVTAAKSAIDSHFSTASNWPYIFQINGLTYYKYGEGGTQANPTSTKEKCVEGFIANRGTYELSAAKEAEINSYITANGLSSSASSAYDPSLTKILDLLDLVGTGSRYYCGNNAITFNNYGLSDLYAWLRNYAECTKSGTTYLLGTISGATFQVGGTNNTYGPGWYDSGCGKDNLTNTALTTAEKNTQKTFYYYPLSSSNTVYGSTHGGWFTDGTYQTYATAKTNLNALYSNSIRLATLSSNKYGVQTIAAQYTTSATPAASIKSNGWTSAAQSQLITAINTDHTSLRTAIKNYYMAIKGLQKLIAYEAYEKAYNLIAMANNTIVTYDPNGATNGLTPVSGTNANLHLYVWADAIVADKPSQTTGTYAGYKSVAAGTEIGGRVYANALATLENDKSMLVRMPSGSAYAGCVFCTYLPEYYMDGEIAKAEKIFTDATKKDTQLLKIDHADADIFSGSYSSPSGTLATSIKLKLDSIYLKGADTKSLTKLILMFMCNNIVDPDNPGGTSPGKPASNQNYSVTGEHIGLGALDYVKEYCTNKLWDNGLNLAANGYSSTIFDTATGLGTSGAALSYRTNTLMKTTGEGGCMSHTNAAATNAGVSTIGGTVNGTTVTGLATSSGFYFYNNYDPNTLKSVIQFMVDNELIKNNAIMNPDAFGYNWTVDNVTLNHADNKLSTFFLATGFFEQEKVTAMCEKLIKLYNGENIYDESRDKWYYGLRLKAADAEMLTNLDARQAVADKINKDWQTYNLESTDWQSFTTLQNKTEAMFDYRDAGYMNFMLNANGNSLITNYGKVMVDDYEDTTVASAVVNSEANSFDAPGATEPSDQDKWDGSLLYRLLHADFNAVDATNKLIHYHDESAPIGKVSLDTVNVRTFASRTANAKYFPEFSEHPEQLGTITTGTFVQPNASGYTMYIYTNQLNPYFVINLQEQLNNVRGADGQAIRVAGSSNGLIDPETAQQMAASRNTTIAQYNCSKPEKMTVQARATGQAKAYATAWVPDEVNGGGAIERHDLAESGGVSTLYTETEPLANGTYAMDSSAVVVLNPQFVSAMNGAAQYVAYSIVANDDAAERKTGEADNAANGTNVEYSSKGNYNNEATDYTNRTKITIMVYYQNSELVKNGVVSDEGYATGTSATPPAGVTGTKDVVAAQDKNGNPLYYYFASSVRSTRQGEAMSSNTWLSGDKLERRFFNNNMKQWEFVSANQTQTPVANDPDYALADLGSFIYVFNPESEDLSDETSLDYQVISAYYDALDGDMDNAELAAAVAKNTMITELQTSAASRAAVREALLDSTNPYVVDYGSTANWTQTISQDYPNGTLIYVHVLDRWGNRVNRMILVDKIDTTAPVVATSGVGAVTVTETDGSGLSTIDAFNYAGTYGSSLYADYHLDRYLAKNGVKTCYENNTFTISGLTPNGHYTIGAMNGAGRVGSSYVYADGDGNITVRVTTGEYDPMRYDVDNAPDELANCSDGEDVGVIEFVLNGTDTVVLNYAMLTSVITAGPEGNVIASTKANTPLNITTKDNVSEVKLTAQDGTTEIWAAGTAGVTVTDNGDGTKTWMKKYAFSEGRHNYTATAKTEEEFEVGGVDFTVNAVNQTVTIDFKTTGLGSFAVYYNGGTKKTISTRGKVTAAVGDVLTLVATPKTINGYTYDFLFWDNKNTERVISTDSTYKFEAVSAMFLEGQFSPNSLSEDSGNKNVVYVNQAGNIVKNIEVAAGETYTAPAGPILQDHVFKGWSKTPAEALASEERTVIVTPVYSIGETYTVEIVNGDYVATGTGVYTCENNERALVNINTSAKNGAGQVFQYWLDSETNDIVSYSRGYAFYAIKNTVLKPVYGDAAVTAQPVIRIATVKYNSTAKKVNFYAERSVPGAYEVIQTGVVVTKTEATGTNENAFVIGGAGTAKGTSINTASAGFYTGVVSISAGETVWARGYLIYRDSAGDIHTVYSPISSYTR